jgi:hypothetical protein
MEGWKRRERVRNMVVILGYKAPFNFYRQKEEWKNPITHLGRIHYVASKAQIAMR